MTTESEAGDTRRSTWIRVAGTSGALAVIAGAFGAHGLREMVSPPLLAAYRTGAHYHLVHSVALLALGLYASGTGRDVSTPAWLFLTGMVLFAGSLYAMALTGVTSLGMVTPFGGLLLIAAWFATAWQLAGRR